MPEIWPAKDPDEVLDYTWAPQLDEGDALSSIELTRISGSVVIDSQSTVSGSRVVWLSGGTDGETNVFEGRATTVAGRTYEETIYLQIISSNVGAGQSGFIAAFPAFASAPAASVAYWSEQAAMITAPFEECLGDRYQFATWLVTAHHLVLAGLGTGAEAQMAAQGMAGFKSIKSGTLSLDRGDNYSAGAGEWGATSYGLRVWPMLKACVAGPRVTGTGSLVGGRFNGYAGLLPGWYR